MTERGETTRKRDQFWVGKPGTIKAWAALNRDGKIMAASVRDRSEDVKLACGECIPIRVSVTYLEDQDD